jgi:Methyltransferase FkbM domain
MMLTQQDVENIKLKQAVPVAIGIVVVLSLLSMTGGNNNYVQAHLSIDLKQSRQLEVLFDRIDNARAVKQWRESSDCHTAIPNFARPTSTTTILEPAHAARSAVTPCQRVVMDFGANIGDTSGKVIDAGLVHKTCSDDQFIVFDVEEKNFKATKKRNMLVNQFTKLMETVGAKIGPEDYCYYGVEGNPVFTKRLQGIENTVMAMRPRPIQHIHFFTESVGAGVDGPTVLYLDTINDKQNYWGSSIFANHQDVVKSKEKGGNIEAPVMGYTIGTLMKKTLSYYKDKVANNHLILKVDIEGGEYPLLHQAVEDGTLCEFCKAGNTADLFIEFHSQRVTGKHDFIGQTAKMKETLTACGVTFRNLEAWWA